MFGELRSLPHHAILIEGEYESVRKELADIFSEEARSENPDFIERVFEQLSIKDARELRDALSRSPFGDSYLIFLATQSATTEAQNALLKSLEEPEARVKLFFVTPSTGVFLPTFLSRFHVVGEEKKLVPVDDFLKADSVGRAKILSKFMGKHTPEEKKEMRKDLLRLLDSLEDALCGEARSTLAHPSVCESILHARRDIDIPAASFKLILERLIFVLPRKK